MSENTTHCDCDANYKDENEHYQIHVVQELMDINKNINQSNIMAIEKHNLMKEQISAIKEQTFANSLSLMCISLCLLAVVLNRN